MRTPLLTLAFLAASAASAQSIEPSLQRVLTSCGATPQRTAILDRVAAVYAQTGSVRQSAQAVGYAYQNMQGLRANGDAAFVLSSLKGICGKLSGLIAYGLAPYGQGLAIIVADPKTPPGLQGASAEGRRLLVATNAARARGANCGVQGTKASSAPISGDRVFHIPVAGVRWGRPVTPGPVRAAPSAPISPRTPPPPPAPARPPAK